MSIKKITRSQFLGTSVGLTILPSFNFGGSALGQLMKPPEDSFRMTEQIKYAYEIGLKILKPTKAQLEHGLELHRTFTGFRHLWFYAKSGS